MKSPFILFVLVITSSLYGQSEFITTWKTDNPGISDNNSIVIPIAPLSVYDFTVNWGDGNIDIYTGTGSVLTAAHTYSIPGTYSVSIAGVFPRIYFNNVGDRLKILSIDQWGNIVWESCERAFYGCANLHVYATDNPNFTNVTSMFRMFQEAIAFNDPIDYWDVSSVENFRSMFSGNSDSPNSFNQQLNSWNTSSAINMTGMFSHCPSFNQPIDNWDVSNVTNMSSLFLGCTAFNQPLNSWDVSNVTSMGSIFAQASSFNQPIGNWNVSNVTDMAHMFHQAISFNQPLGEWNVSNVTNMTSMFRHAHSFDQPLSSWEISNAESIWGMFESAYSFNQPLSNWSFPNLSNSAYFGLAQMFSNATSFNQPLNMWDVSNIAGMSNMFQGATAFNQPLDNWDVSNVETMELMFNGATAFDQSLDTWNLSSCWNFSNMLNNSGLSYCNYDQTLQGWAAQSPNNWQTLGATGLQYTSAGAPARFQLVDTHQWTITGDALIIPDALEVNSFINGTEMSVSASGGTGNYNYQWTGPNGFESTDSSIVAPQNGIYTVIVSDGCYQWSDTFELLTVGIEILESAVLAVYPNPTNGPLSVQIEKEGLHNLQILDLTGKIVLNSILNKNVTQFDLSNLDSGLYLCRLLDSQQNTIALQRVCIVR